MKMTGSIDLDTSNIRLIWKGIFQSTTFRLFWSVKLTQKILMGGLERETLVLRREKHPRS